AWGDTPTAPENGVWSESAATADHPQVLFAGQGWKIVGDDGAPLANDRLLYVTAEDAGSGIAKLIYRTKAVPSGGNGEVLLEVEAVDLVGNSATRTWPIGRRWVAALDRGQGGRAASPPLNASEESLCAACPRSVSPSQLSPRSPRPLRSPLARKARSIPHGRRRPRPPASLALRPTTRPSPSCASSRRSCRR